MVRIQVKHGRRQHVNGADGELEFLYDCETSSTIQQIIQDTTEIANLQLQIQQLGYQLLPPVSALLHTHRPQVIALHRTLSEATSYASKGQVLHGKPLSSLVLRDYLRSIETEFVVNYKLLNFQDSKFKQLLSDLELLHEDTVQLLWAGKELVKGKILRDYIGKNEKTKVYVFHGYLAYRPNDFELFLNSGVLVSDHAQLAVTSLKSCLDFHPNQSAVQKGDRALGLKQL